MPYYIWVAETKKGRKLKGEIEAVDEKIALSQLKRRNLAVKKLKPKPKDLFESISWLQPKVTNKDIVQVAYLTAEIMRGIPLERDVPPLQIFLFIGFTRFQSRCVGIVEICNHDYGLRMLRKTVRQFVQGKPGIFEADFLAHNEERHGREAGVHFAQHPAQDGAVADTGVEHPDCGRLGI